MLSLYSPSKRFLDVHWSSRVLTHNHMCSYAVMFKQKICVLTDFVDMFWCSWVIYTMHRSAATWSVGNANANCLVSSKRPSSPSTSNRIYAYPTKSNHASLRDPIAPKNGFLFLGCSQSCDMVSRISTGKTAKLQLVPGSNGCPGCVSSETSGSCRNSMAILPSTSTRAVWAWKALTWRKEQRYK